MASHDRLVGTWIEFDQDHLTELRDLAHPQKVLQRCFVMQQLTLEQLERKKRCLHCNKVVGDTLAKQKSIAESETKLKERKVKVSSVNETTIKKSQNDEIRVAISESIYMINQLSTSVDVPSSKEAQFGNNSTMNMVLKDQLMQPNKTDEPNAPPEPLMRCRFHSGQLYARKWSCCGQPRYAPASAACKNHEYHIPMSYPAGSLEKFWEYHETPSGNPSNFVRPAVAIDCEMGISTSGDSVLIRVTLIDYFSSELLINSLVWPEFEIENLQTRYSGVSWSDMHQARRRKECFNGTAAAREAVWQYLRPETVLIGHGVQNDLSALRWIHQNIVDTLIINQEKVMEKKRVTEAVEKQTKAEQAKEENIRASSQNFEAQGNEHPTESMETTAAQQDSEETNTTTNDKLHQESKIQKVLHPLSLKTLAKQRLGRDIQIGGSRGHDSVEDALAARDLAHWELMNRRQEGKASV